MKKTSSSGVGLFGTLFRRPRTEKRRPEGESGGLQKLWVLRDRKPVAVKVKTGATDGRVTELRNSELKPGDDVIIDAVSKTK